MKLILSFEQRSDDLTLIVDDPRNKVFSEPVAPDRSTRMLKEGCSRSAPTTARYTARNSGGS